MYLSKLIMSREDPRALRSIANPYEMHRTIWRAFPDAGNGGPGRVLFRVEPLATGKPVVVLVQSQRQPDWGPLLNERIVLEAECKRFEPAFAAGQLLRFRLIANPSKKITDRERTDARGQPKKARVGLFGEANQRAWLERKARESGFELCEHRVSSRWNSDGRKPDASPYIRHHAVVFEGILRVTDPGLFLRALESGIGSAKGFGFGLLSVAPLR